MIYQVHIYFKSFDNISIDNSIIKILQIRNFLKAFENDKSLVDVSLLQSKGYKERSLYKEGIRYKGYAEGRYSLPTLKKKFTVLRSPHIDKKSREQFEWTRYKKSLFLSFQTLCIFSLFLFLLKNSSFPGVQIQINLRHSTYPLFLPCTHCIP